MQQKLHRVFLRKVNFDFSKSSEMHFAPTFTLMGWKVPIQVHSIPEFLPEVVTAAYYYMYTSAWCHGLSGIQ